MEEVYGAEVFAKKWEAWVDGVAQFADRPDGTVFMLSQTHYTSEVKQKTENHLKKESQKMDENYFGDKKKQDRWKNSYICHKTSIPLIHTVGEINP